jgi:hypothetical protein
VDSTKFALEVGEVFRLFRPLEATGGCPEHSDPIFRLWNGREDTNHVYTTDTAFRDALRERGYILEGYGPDGVNMCAPTP